jgi:pyruvyl transferase EpsO
VTGAGHAAISGTAAPTGAPGRRGPGDAALLESLARRLRQTLDPLIPVDRPVALLDFPLTPNVGDNMIWLGAEAALAARGIRPRYVCGIRTYARAELARQLGDGTILLSGGGNLGDLYPPHQEFRERVIRDFPGNPIVQLPQTVHFDSADARARARAAFHGHPRLTLLVRDAPSLEVARELAANAALCPDMAFALGALAPPPDPAHPVVWLAREDKEAAVLPHAGVPPGVVRADWLTDPPGSLAAAHQKLGAVAARHRWLRGLARAPWTRGFTSAARDRLARGIRTLGAGRVVVSDRLHGHILCLLLGIPHVALDNRHGKLGGFRDAWTREATLAEWAGSEGEALERALAMAGN